MPKKDKDDELLREIRENFRIWTQFWEPIYKAGDEDMQCLSAEYGPWPEEQIKKRQIKGQERPIIHCDVISQFNRRIGNTARMNPRGIVITPKGSSATDDTAEMREDRIRQIDQESLAPQARMNALEAAVNRAVGFYGVTVEPTRFDSWEFKIGTRQFPNPRAVMLDPYAKKPDWSDMKGAFVIDRYEYGQYKREFKNADPVSFSEEAVKSAPGWLDDKSVQVCEYWRVEEKPDTLLLVQGPAGPTKLFLSEMDGAEIEGKTVNGAKILKQRKVERPEVWQYITNGLEILRRSCWTEECGGTSIPIIIVTGYRKYEKDKLVIESATRKMRPGQLLYDYVWTNITEQFGMIPKSHWQAVFGQTEDSPEYADANTTPTAVLRHHAKVAETGDEMLGAPIRVDYTPNVEGQLHALTYAMQAVQQAAGMFSVERQDQVKASGKAQQVQNESQDIGNFHFADYLDLAVQYEGRIKNEILRHVEDTDAMRGFRKEDDSYEQKQVTPMADPDGNITQHPYGKGRDHDVIVKAGPSMQSQWDKAQGFIMDMSKNPQYAPLVMPELVHMMQLGPLGAKLEDVFTKMRNKLFPDLQDKDPNDPQQAQQAQQQKLQQASQQLDQLKQAFDAVHQELLTTQQKLQSKTVETDGKVKMNELDNAVKLMVANIEAKQEKTAQDVELFGTRMDHLLQILSQSRDQQHDVNMQAAQAQVAQQQQGADQAHEAGMQTQQLGAQADQQDQAHQAAMEQQQQAQQAQPQQQP